MASPYVSQSPAAAWIKGDDISADERLANFLTKFGSTPGTGVFGLTLDDVCQMATDILFVRSGQLYFGPKVHTVRPHRLVNRRRSLPGPVGWGYAYSGAYGQFSRWFPEGWPDSSVTEKVRLDGPNTAVSNVTLFDPAHGIAGTMDPSLYKLVGRDLYRMADPLTNAPMPWPADQRIDEPMGQPYTWSITYSYGSVPDMGGILAVRELAIELAITIAAGKSRISQRVQNLSQHGTNVSLVTPPGRLGIAVVDEWVDSINPAKLRRRPSIYSPQSVVPTVSS